MDLMSLQAIGTIDKLLVTVINVELPSEQDKLFWETLDSIKKVVGSQLAKLF